MDKNKSRTDLLAAGRKKLQQFRQKKEIKSSASHGKSSKNYGKAEQADADASSTTLIPTAPPEVTEKETPRADSNREISDSPVSHSIGAGELDTSSTQLREDQEADGLDSKQSDRSSEIELEGDLQLPFSELGESAEALSTIVSLKTNMDEVSPEPEQSGESGDVSAYDGATLSDGFSASVLTLNEVDGISSANLAMTNQQREEIVPGSYYEENSVMPFPHGDNGRGREEKSRAVLDNRTTAEGYNQQYMSDESFVPEGKSETKLKVDQQISLSEPGINAEALPRLDSVNNIVEVASHEAEQTGESGEVSTSDVATLSDGFSASVLALNMADGISTGNPAMQNQQREQISSGSSCEENLVMLFQSDGLGKGRGENTHFVSENRTGTDGYNRQYMPEESCIAEAKSPERPLEAKCYAEGQTVSPVADVSAISLMQLTEVIRGLNEEEFRFLLDSRESVSNAELGTGGGAFAKHGFTELLQRLNEELILTHFTKDIFHLQLAEHSELEMELEHQHYQLVDEISVLNASLKEAHESNQFLAEEHVQCRSELQTVTSRWEELEDQFRTAKAEVEEFSSRARELESRLERSERDLLSLSTELDGCKILIADLQVENKKLDGTIASMTEERQKLVEERVLLLNENENLSKELADGKSLLAALQVENSNLSGSLSSVTEERTKLEVEKGHLFHANEKLSLELAECKGLVAALQVENTSLNGSLALVTEQRSRLEEDKEHLNLESERFTSKLFVLQDQFSTEHAERMKVESSLKEMTMRLEQLTDENILLQSSLEVFKAKVREIDGQQSPIPCQAGEAGNEVSQEVRSSGHESVTDYEDSHQTTGKQDGEVYSPVLEKPLSDGLAVEPPIPLPEQEVSDDSYGFVALKGHLEGAEKILQKLEKAIEGAHFHSTSFSRKVAAPGISKLIQAFESNVHVDEQEEEERDSTENQSPADPFMVTKELAGNLRALIKQLGMDAENASVLFTEERDGRKIADATFRELTAEHKALKEHSNNLEAANIELEVLFEALKQHVCEVEVKDGELEVLFESLKLQGINLKAENRELGEKLCGYQSRISDLQSRLDDLQHGSNEMASSISNQLENMQKEMAERVLLLEDWNSTVAEILEAVGKLDESVGEVLTSTISIGTQDGMNVSSRVAASVSAATKVIEALQEKLQAAQTDHEEICTLHKHVNEKFDDLHGKNELAMSILHKMHGRLRQLVISSCGSVDESEKNIQIEKLLDPLDYSEYEMLLEQLDDFLEEKLQLRTVNNKLTAELIRREREFEEMSRRCLDAYTVHKLVDDVESVLKLGEDEINLDKTHTSHLESVVSLLVQKFKELDAQVGLSREEFGSKMVELTELQDKIHQLESLCFEHENEIFILKDSLHLAEETLIAARSELREKRSELEQTEQRVSSIREKLGIAVAKGKGLVVQRDGLKQSLADTSSQLERCLHELQLKDSRIQEVETKLKTYSEAGERVEALESELSYIRNSATALRESFLHKDSVLQRIEEILEDLDLPEHFHSRDIIEKIDWLARSTTGNSVPLTDWDQKSSAVGGSYSDAAFAALDSWKDDVQPSSNSEDDMRRKFEELQNRLYGLAEQNEMLEQSLMERNDLVQRLEELLDRIDMPSQFRSVEPEDRIEWLGKALSEAQHDRNSLLQKIDNFENYCGSLSADLEESQRRVSELEADLQAVSREREDLSERLEILTHEHEKHSARMVEFKLEKEKLQNEVTGLSEKLVERLGNEEKIVIIEGKIKRLQDLASDALQESGTIDLVSGSDSIHCLEELLRKLIENYAILSSKNPVIGDAADRHHAENVDAIAEVRSIDMLDSREQDIALLKTELEEAMRELIQVREERDRYLEKQQSLFCEVEALSIKREELEKLLSQEEQKSASVREKFNIAVRKGKSLVQQRDGLKQIIDEKNAEVENLKSEITYRENALAEYEQKFKKLSAYPERVEALESECLLLRNRLTETEHYLQEKGRILNMALNALNNIDVDGEFNSGDPIERLEQLGKLFYDLRTAVASSEQEMRKSKKAAELLLAELNEVQERNDVLQEELATAANEVVELTKERDLAEAAKLEANSRLESLSTVRSEERKNQLSEFMGIKSGLNQLRKGFHDVNNLLADVFSKDLEFLHNLEAGIDSCLKTKNVEQVVVPFFFGSDGFITGDSDSKEMDSWSNSKTHGQLDEDVFGIYNFVMHHLHEFVTEIGDLEEKLRKHSVSLHKQNSSLSNLVAAVHGEMTSQKESVESMKRDIIRIESVKSEKDMELIILQRNIAVLYEACASSVMEVENHRVDLVGNNMTAGEVGLNLKSTAFADGGQAHFSSEESIRNMADRLVLAVRNFASLKTETIVGNGKEMKITIANLQKELHEKDIQNERICSELVSQIKEAEAATRSYSLDLQSSQTRVHDLEEHVEAIERERNLLKQRVKELQDAQVASTELQDRVRSYTDVLAAKDQEIEALMQALDEEEAQMETLTNKIEELEKVVQQKNLDVKNLEGSRGKALKKLSITVTKFDELHQFSESLLAEVEKLQAQMQDRDAEISFLRQEVTRCTNDVLVASQMSSKRTSDEIHEFLAWFDSMIARFGVHDVHLDDKNDRDIHEHKEILQKKITSIISELEDLWAVAQRKDALLEVERSKVEELTHKEEFLEKSLREKESRLNLLEGVRDSERATSMTSEILEVEPVVNKWTVAGTSIASQVRSLRKGNNDQVAVAIDMDPGSSGRLEDEDDDKVHGFKSLVTSRIVPRFTRPVTDMIDGLWVSCDRALMRQPALRLGIIIYWAILHALLATVVV